MKYSILLYLFIHEKQMFVIMLEVHPEKGKVLLEEQGQSQQDT